MINGASNTVSEVDSHCELDLSSYLLVSRKISLLNLLHLKELVTFQTQTALIHLFIEANVSNNVFMLDADSF